MTFRYTSLRFYRIDLVDFLTLFLRQINKKAKIKDLKIKSPLPLSAKISTNFGYFLRRKYPYCEEEVIYYTDFLYNGKYYGIILDELVITIYDYGTGMKYGVQEFYYFYEEMIFFEVYSLFEEGSLIKLMMKEVLNEETRRLIRRYLTSHERVIPYSRLFSRREKIGLRLDCRGRLYSPRNSLSYLQIIRIGNFKRIEAI